MFPFKVKFTNKLKTNINSDKEDSFFKFIEEQMSNEGADFYSRGKHSLNIENKLFSLKFNWGLMVPVDSGIIEIYEKDNQKKLKYVITFYRLWIISALFSILIFLTGETILGALIAFGLLGLGNWLFAIIRHIGFFNELKRYLRN